MVMMVILVVVVVVVVVVMVLLMRRELITVTMMLERLRLEVMNRLWMRLMLVVRGMTSRGVAPGATATATTG